ncbi:sterol desaturase family protein [Streptomyces catenulae]|uniref:Sterol desaturase family protein n=1 Tax=Streptomyces catenulae TaxID=66875 RepID=A0ABV2Z205_9ACTN|nr:sterol desaturase family protein [Streptomyces catenulae]
MDLASLLLWLSAPVFLLAMLVELLVLRRRRLPSYDKRDSFLNIATALGNQLAAMAWAFVQGAVLLWLHSAVPWRLTGWVAWAVGMVAVDFAYYWFHRAHHEIRALWAVHVVHHSSERYNLSVALRQPFLVVTTLPFLLPVVLTGIRPETLTTCFAINLVYQFFIHTELVDKLWAPVEYVLNTPSHHRVHHGSQEQYLDKNYGGILILWDRLFGTFEPEGERVRYGLTKNIHTYRIVRVQTHELAAMARDILHAENWSARLGYALRGPGWTPGPSLGPGEAN